MYVWTKAYLISCDGLLPIWDLRRGARIEKAKATVRFFIDRVLRVSKRALRGTATGAKRVAYGLGAATFLILVAAGSPATLAGWAGVTAFSSITTRTNKWLRKKLGREPTSINETQQLIMGLGKDQLEELLENLKNEISQQIRDDNKFGEDFTRWIRLSLENIGENLNGVLRFIEGDIAAIGEEFSNIDQHVREVVSKIDSLIKEHEEVLKWVKECKLTDIDEIIDKSNELTVDEINKAKDEFKTTIRLDPERLMALVMEGEVVFEREIEKVVLEILDSDGSNVLILGESGSGKSVLLTRLCYESWKKGWKAFYTRMGIDASKAIRVLEEKKKQGKLVVFFDNAGLDDGYFNFLENRPTMVGVVMAEQDLVWENRKRSVAGYGFKKLRLDLTENERRRYMDIHGVKEGAVRESIAKAAKNILAVLAFLTTKGKGTHSLEKIANDIWTNLDNRERETCYPILLLSSLGVGYPKKLFIQMHDNEFLLNSLVEKGLIASEGKTISTMHPLISSVVLRERCREIDDRAELNQIQKTVEGDKVYFELSHRLGAGIAEARRIELFPIAILLFLDQQKMEPEYGPAYVNCGTLMSTWAKQIASIDRGEAEKKYEEACNQYKRATEIYPKDDIAFFDWGTALNDWAGLVRRIDRDRAETKYEESCNKYDTATKLNPRFAIAFNNWGTALNEWATYISAVNPSKAESKYKEACGQFQQAMKLDPEDPLVLSNWALALMMWASLIFTVNRKEAENKYSEGYSKFQRAINMAPSNFVAVYNWGTGLSEWADSIRGEDRQRAESLYMEARDKFETAIALNPEFATAIHNLGIIHFKLAELTGGTDPEGAKKKLIQGAEYRGRAAFLLYKQNQVDDSLKSFRALYGARKKVDTPICYECGIAYAALLSLRDKLFDAIVGVAWRKRDMVCDSARILLDYLVKGDEGSEITQVQSEKDFTFKDLLQKLRKKWGETR